MTSPTATQHGDVTVIEAGRLEQNYWKELWSHRELLVFLAWRDILVRYKQTSIGVTWALIRPLVTMIVFTVIFGKLAGLPSGAAPYPVMVLAGLLSWQLFASAFGDMATSLVTNASMVTKVYFPKMVVPLSVIAVGLLDLAIALVILAALMAWYGYAPDWRIITLPVFVLFAILAVAGPGLLVAAVTVKYRDFRYVAPFIVQLGLFASPVGFQSAVIPEQYRLLYSLNPMVGVIDGFRWSLLRGDGGLYVPGLVVSAVVSFVLLLMAVRFFRRAEANFADVI